MNTSQQTRRTDTASRLIKAAPDRIYRALTTAEAVATWRAPTGMKGEVYAFDARPGGQYRMALRYEQPPPGGGKTAEDLDSFEGRFLELDVNERVVEVVEFESVDVNFAGSMTITTELKPVDGGTLVQITCSNVPPGIKAEDHEAGLASALENLARYTEQDQ